MTTLLVWAMLALGGADDPSWCERVRQRAGERIEKMADEQKRRVVRWAIGAYRSLPEDSRREIARAILKSLVPRKKDE
jgi:hypothetical protein